MIIDAKNLILGRLASFAAKQSLLGKEVNIVNCEEAVVTGNKNYIFEKYKDKLEKGSMRKGPFFYRRPDRFIKRVVRGMLPYKKENGKKAFKRIRCYVGVPKELINKKTEDLKEMSISKLKITKYVKLKDLCRQLGARI